jgi:hypothetical protein
MDTQCKALNKASEPCGGTHYRDGWCYWHHPDLEPQRLSQRIAGGKAKANSARARKRILAAGMELPEVDAALCQALTDVLAGELEPNIGTAAATIAKAITSVRQAGELEKRVIALEAQKGWRR